MTQVEAGKEDERWTTKTEMSREAAHSAQSR